MRLVLASNNAQKLVELQTLFAPLRDRAGRRRARSASPRPTSRTPRSSRTRWRRRATRARASGCRRSPTTPACASMRSAARRAWCRRTSPSVDAATGDREARRGSQDAANNALLLARLQGADDRRARFVSTLVALRSADDPEPLIADRPLGAARSLHAPRGGGGFGYDPLVFIPALGRSVAELSADVKNEHSHRALARACGCWPLMREAVAAVRRRTARALPGSPARCSSPRCRHCRCTCTCRGACEVPVLRLQFARAARAALARARATSTRCVADLEEALPLVWGRPRAQRLHRRRHAEPVLAGSDRPAARRGARAAAAGAGLRGHARSQPRHVRARALPRLSRRRRARACRSACRASTTTSCARIGRVHDAAQARAAIEEARERVRHLQPRPDVCAAAADARSSCIADLDTALAFEPPHLSLYHLTLEPNTLLRATHPPPLPDDDLARDDARCDRRAHRRARASSATKFRPIAQAGPPLRAQPQLLAVRRLPRHRRRRARQAELRAPHRAPGALARARALHGRGAGRPRDVATSTRSSAKHLPFEFMLNALRLSEGFELRDVQRAHRVAAAP